MSLKVNNISNYHNKIAFKAETEEKTAQKPSENKEEKKSYWERNKNAILAISALGIAGITFAAHHHLKKVERFNDGDFIGALSRSAKAKLQDFKSNLKLHGDNTSEDIKNILSSDDGILKFEAIKHITENSSKHINEKTWENIFDTVTSLKPNNKLKEEFIVARINNVLEKMHENNLFKSEVIDKVLTKTENLNENFKVNILHNLTEGYFQNFEHIVPKFNSEQIEKSLNMIDKIQGNDFVFQKSAGGMINFNTKINVTGLRYEFSKQIFENLKLDENFISQFKKVISNDKLSDDLKLQLIHGIHYNHRLDNRYSDIGRKLDREMLLAIFNNKADKYSEPHKFITTVNKKFDLGYSIYKDLSSDYDNVAASLEEKLQFTRNLKKMYETLDDTKGQSYKINELYNDELSFKRDIFFKNFSDNTTLADIEKFVDEMLNDFKAAKEHFIDTNDFYSNRAKEDMSHIFDSFRLRTYMHLQKLKNPTKLNGEKVSFKVEEKIEEFAEKYFGAKRSYKNNYYNDSKFNSTDYFVDIKSKQAKATILDFLSNDKDFKDILEQLKTASINKNMIKNLKRKVAIKYHPDRIGAKTEEEQMKATADYQKINGAIDILESTLV